MRILHKGLNKAVYTFFFYTKLFADYNGLWGGELLKDSYETIDFDVFKEQKRYLNART